MNLIVNSHGATTAMPTVSAVALRVRDAAFAHKHSLDLGAWDMPTRASAMELSIPGIHGVGDSLIYFVDRYRDFSIYDVDFIPLPGADPRPAALAGLHYFGVVQAILASARATGWTSTASVRLLGAAARPVFRRAAEGHAARESLPQVLSPAGRAPPGADDIQWDEGLVRLGLGAANVPGRCARCRSAASCSSTTARCSRATGRADPVLSGRRHL